MREIPMGRCWQVPAYLHSSWLCNELFFLTIGPTDQQQLQAHPRNRGKSLPGTSPPASQVSTATGQAWLRRFPWELQIVWPPHDQEGWAVWHFSDQPSSSFRLLLLRFLKLDKFKRGLYATILTVVPWPHWILIPQLKN